MAFRPRTSCWYCSAPRAPGHMYCASCQRNIDRTGCVDLREYPTQQDAHRAWAPESLPFRAFVVGLVLAIAAPALAQVPSPPTLWTRDDVDALFGRPAMAGPLDAPWEAGSVLAAYPQTPGDLNGPCRARLPDAPDAKWFLLAYFTPAGKLVATHCVQLGDLDTGHDVLPDVVRRLLGRRT